MNFSKKACFLAVLISLSACSKHPPKCSDSQTIDLLRSVVVENFGFKESFSKAEIERNLVFEYPRASGFDESIEKYGCEAKLVVGGASVYAIQVPITYASQLDDKGDHVVSFSGIAIGDFNLVKMAFASGVVKIREASSGNSKTSAPSATVKYSEDISGEWTGQLEGDGNMSIKKSPSGFDVSISVSSESGCLGSVDGTASLTKNSIVLTKNEEGQVCTVSIVFSGKAATLNEENCSYYHGAACGFSGSLKKVE